MNTESNLQEAVAGVLRQLRKKMEGKLMLADNGAAQGRAL